MPPAGPQGSRGGLITAVVVFSIGFVAATICAVSLAVSNNKLNDDLALQKKRTQSMYVDTSSPMVQQLIVDAQSNPNLKERTALADSISWTQTLAALAGGADPAATTQPSAVVDKAQKALSQASVRLKGVALPNNLIGAINALASYAAAQQQQVEDLKKSGADTSNNAASSIDADSVKVKQAAADLAKANDQIQTLNDQIQKSHDEYQVKQTQLAGSIDQERRVYNDNLRDMQNQVQDREKQISQLTRQKAALENVLAGKRISVDEPVVRRPDGKITSVASEDVVYINLGEGDHIVPGMTFEVYAREDGVPKLGDGMRDEDMPTGLGSIEVQRVDAFTSQCRATLQPGQHITEGDLIANLVYDRNTKYNFVVYGKFDLGRMGAANDRDRQKVEGLIVHWGGHIQSKIDVDTDFVVMGFEPTVDNYSAEQLQDPFMVRQKLDQEAALKEYNDRLEQAKELSIPIMNQNRFLYFCGYYNQAQR